MFWIIFTTVLKLTVAAGLVLSKEDVRVCYDISGCEHHDLICQPAEHIIIEEAYLGYNCSGQLFHPNCKNEDCCRHAEDFGCWDMLDVIPVRSLCDKCWRQARCTPTTRVSPNRCSTGINVKPVYSVIKFTCIPDHVAHEDKGEDICSEYLIEHPRLGNTHNNKITTPNDTEPSRTGLTRGVIVGVALTIIILLVLLLILLLAMFVTKRKKSKKATKTTESQETSSESLPEYHVLESTNKRNSNRMSTYYNTINDLCMSRQASVMGDNSSGHGKANSSRSKNRNPVGQSENYNDLNNSNLYTSIRKPNKRKNDNSANKGKGNNSTVERDAEYNYLGENQNKQESSQYKTSGESDEDYHHLYNVSNEVYDNIRDAGRDVRRY